MENKRILKSSAYKTIFSILTFIILLLPTNTSFSYEISTHKNLHQNIIDEYQRITGKTLKEEEIQAFLSGAALEDTMLKLRPTQHFYDPINKKGLTDKYSGKTYPSYIWASNPYIQGNFTTFGFKSKKDKNTNLFEYKNDYSFYRAVYEYAHEKGDKQRAMRAL